MNSHYFRNALGSLRRHSGFSLINFLGLTLALLCSLLIILYVISETSFDHFHEKGEDIYRVYMRQPGNLVAGSSSDWWVVSPAILKPTWEEELPGIRAISRTLDRQWVFRQGESYLYEQVLLVDPGFFEVFTFPLKGGDSGEALLDPFSMVISSEAAQKYFGKENPLGRILMTNDSIAFTITGVLEEIPGNSHLQFDFLAPLLCLEILEGRSLIHPDWTYNNSYTTYLTLHEATDLEEFDRRLRRYDVDGFNDSKWSFHLQHLYDIHFNRETGGRGSRVSLFVFITVGLFILGVACFNYMNLSIMHQRARIRNIALRKVLGASRGSLMEQFFFESLFLLLLASLAALIALRLVLPWFNALMGLRLYFTMIAGWKVLLILGVLIFAIAAISGFYPALYLSRLSLMNTLRGGAFKLTRGRNYVRKGVVVIQFSLSIALILVSLTIFRQLKYLEEKDPGYRVEDILYMRLNIWSGLDWQQIIDPFKQELLETPGIEKVAASTGVPSRIGWSNVPVWEGRDEEDKPFFYRLAVDFDFMDLYDIRIGEGRSFSREMGYDDGRAFIINREAAERMGMESAPGAAFGFWDQKGTVVGVVEGFHFESLHKPITPLGIGVDEQRYFTYISVRLNDEKKDLVLNRIQESWKRFAPGQPFEYTFMDERMDELYRKDRQLSSSIVVLSLMALFISCLGIFGLVSFSLRERIKELGIRKVLGAAPARLGLMLTREMFLLLAVSSVLGGPIGWYASRTWLGNFASQFHLNPGLILISIGITMLIAIIPLGFRLVKSVMASPVAALRTE